MTLSLPLETDRALAPTGSIKERAVFKYARTRDYSIGHKDDGWDAHSESEEEVTHEEDDQVPDVPDVPARPKLSIRFKEVSWRRYGDM